MFDIVKYELFMNNNNKIFINIMLFYISKDQENFIIISLYINKIYINCEIILLIFEKLIII